MVLCVLWGSDPNPLWVADCEPSPVEGPDREGPVERGDEEPDHCLQWLHPGMLGEWPESALAQVIPLPLASLRAGGEMWLITVFCITFALKVFRCSVLLLAEDVPVFSRVPIVLCSIILIFV